MTLVCQQFIVTVLLIVGYMSVLLQGLVTMSLMIWFCFMPIILVLEKHN